MRFTALALVILDILGLCQAKVVPFEITLTWEDAAPDGFQRKVILTDGQLPGPPLYVDQGDDVEFLVRNNLPFETTVHFHGINQLGTPWSDGVPGLSQRPIKPGKSFLYKWNANEYGSYFYHAHAKGQIDDGLYGAIYIRPNDNVEKPFSQITDDPTELDALRHAEQETKPIILSDWSHLTSSERWAAEEATGLDSYCTNAILVNGKGSSICLGQATINAYTSPPALALLNGIPYTDLGCLPPTSPAVQGAFPHNFSAAPPGLWSGCEPTQGPTETLVVDSEKKYASYNLISAAGTSTFVFSIDQHPMWVYAVDGRYVKPTQADALTIANGQRFSIMVPLDKPAATYNVRTVVTGLNQIQNSTAFLSYSNAPANTAPSTPSILLNGLNATESTTFWNESLAIPFPPQAPAPIADEMYVLKLDRFNASYRWVMGDSNFPLSLNDDQPLLFNPNAQGEHSNLTVRTKNGSWVDLVFTPMPPLQPPHPIHKHSTKFFVIGSGMGLWNYSSTAEAMKAMPQNFNLVNPPIRDTYPTLPAIPGSPSWLVLRYHSVNPGAFLVHCHIQVHLSGGMALALLDGIDEWPHIPDGYGNGGGGGDACPT